MKKILFLFFSIIAITGISQVTVSTFEGIDSVKIDDAVYVANDGSIYGSHFEGTRVYKIKPDGTVSVFADGFLGPNGLEFDSKGFLYVVNHKANKVYKVAPDGSKTEFVSSVHRPSGIIKLPNSDTMLITRYYANLILKVAPDGKMDTLAIGDQLNGPVGLVFDENGELYTGNFNDRRIIHIRRDGTQSEIIQIPGGQYLGFLAYHNGIFYGTSFQLSQIYQVRKSDTVMTLLAGKNAGEIDGDTSVALFNRPNGIAMSLTGDSIFVSDYATQNVRIITGYNISNSIENITIHPTVKVYPNPASNSFYVKLRSVKSFKSTIQLIDLTGRIIFEKHQQIETGINDFQLSISNITPGNYFLKISSHKSALLKKIVFQ